MATWIISGLLLIAVFFAARYTIRKMKKGECPGCSGSSCGGCGCCHGKKITEAPHKT